MYRAEKIKAVNIPIDYCRNDQNIYDKHWSLSSLPKKFIRDQQTEHLSEAKHVWKKIKANSQSELHPEGVAQIAYMRALFWVMSGQSSCLFPYLACRRVLPWSAQRFLGGWQDILWAGISSFLLPAPRVALSRIPQRTTEDILWDVKTRWDEKTP